MVCPVCGKDNVTVTSEQSTSKTGVNGAGCLWDLLYWTLVLCTCGLWLIFGKHKGSGKTKYKYNTVCICQNCGHKWTI